MAQAARRSCAILRRDRRPNFLVIQAASGAGKSSFLRAGLWPRLDRDPDVAFLGILRPATGILTGPAGIGRKLAEQLSRSDHPINPGDVHAQLMLLDVEIAATAFKKWIGLVVDQARERRKISDKGARTPTLLLAVDQAEELLSTEDETETKRFLALLAILLRDPPTGVDLFALLTIRTEASPALLKKIEELGSEVPDILPLLPVPPASYRDVIFEPLRVLARGGRRVTITARLGPVGAGRGRAVLRASPMVGHTQLLKAGFGRASMKPHGNRLPSSTAACDP